MSLQCCTGSALAEAASGPIAMPHPSEGLTPIPMSTPDNHCQRDAASTEAGAPENPSPKHRVATRKCHDASVNPALASLPTRWPATSTRHTLTCHSMLITAIATDGLCLRPAIQSTCLLKFAQEPKRHITTPPDTPLRRSAFLQRADALQGNALCAQAIPMSSATAAVVHVHREAIASSCSNRLLQGLRRSAATLSQPSRPPQASRRGVQAAPGGPQPPCHQQPVPPAATSALTRAHRGRCRRCS